MESDGAEGGAAGWDRDSPRGDGQDTGSSDRDLATADQDLGTADQDLGTADRDLGTADQDLGTADRDLATDDQDLGTADRDLATADQDLGTADQDLGTADRDLATDDQDLGTADLDLGTDDRTLGTADKNLGTADQDLGTADKNLGTSDQDLGTADRKSGSGDRDLGTGEEDRSAGARHALPMATQGPWGPSGDSCPDGPEGNRLLAGSPDQQEQHSQEQVQTHSDSDSARSTTDNYGDIPSLEASQSSKDVSGDQREIIRDSMENMTPGTASNALTGIVGDMTTAGDGSEAAIGIVGDVKPEAGSGHTGSVDKPEATETMDENTARDVTERFAADTVGQEAEDGVQGGPSMECPGNRDVDSARTGNRRPVSDTAVADAARARDPLEQVGGWTEDDNLSEEDDVDEEALVNLCRWVDSGKRLSLEAARCVSEAGKPEDVQTTQAQWGADLLVQCDPETSDGDDDDDVGSRLREVAETLERAGFVQDFRSRADPSTLTSGHSFRSPSPGQHDPGRAEAHAGKCAVDSEWAGSQSTVSERRSVWSQWSDGKAVRRESVRLKRFTEMAEHQVGDERSQRLKHVTEMAEDQVGDERSQCLKHVTEMAEDQVGDERSQRLKHVTEMAEDQVGDERSQRLKHVSEVAEEGDVKSVDVQLQDVAEFSPSGKTFFSPPPPPPPPSQMSIPQRATMLNTC